MPVQPVKSSATPRRSTYGFTPKRNQACLAAILLLCHYQRPVRAERLIVFLPSSPETGTNSGGKHTDILQYYVVLHGYCVALRIRTSTWLSGTQRNLLAVCATRYAQHPSRHPSIRPSIGQRHGAVRPAVTMVALAAHKRIRLHAFVADGLHAYIHAARPASRVRTSIERQAGARVGGPGYCRW